MPRCGRKSQQMISHPSFLLTFVSPILKPSRHSRPVGKSAPFRVWAKFEPLSAPLQFGIRFFPFPIPALSSACLTTCLPIARRGYGLTTFRISNLKGLGAIFSPVPFLSSLGYSENPNLGHLPFWLRYISIFYLVELTDPAMIHVGSPCPSA